MFRMLKISLNFVPSEEDKVCFSNEELEVGAKCWELSLVGYAIGRRPFYGYTKGPNAMDPMRDLERLQIGNLERISELERAFRTQLAASNTSNHGANHTVTGEGDATESRLSLILRSMGVSDFIFKTVPLDYYDKTLEERKQILGASSVYHLCKSIVMVNTQAPANIIDCNDHKNSKYYIVVVQYAARLNAENIKNFLYALNNQKIPKKRFNLRLAPEEESLKLTGFVHNAVTCVGMKTDIPVILDEAIVKLQPDFFWLGGGEVNLKLGIRTSEFISAIKPFLESDPLWLQVEHCLKRLAELCFYRFPSAVPHKVAADRRGFRLRCPDGANARGWTLGAKLSFSKSPEPFHFPKVPLLIGLELDRRHTIRHEHEFPRVTARGSPVRLFIGSWARL